MADAPDTIITTTTTTDGTAATVAPHGSWKSPVTSDLIVQGSVGLGLIALDGADTYWIEVRPGEGGRSVIVRRDGSGLISDVTPAGFNARTRVHEYGGGDYTVAQGVVYFANFADQRLYYQRVADKDVPQPLTPAGVDLRYADMTVDLPRRRLVAVREEHATASDGSEPVNTLVGISFDADDAGDAGMVLAAGYDFFSSPRLSPDGKRLAWLCWNHPNMPWDGTELWVGELDADGNIVRRELIAGGRDESIFQPEWSPEGDGALYFVSDRTGWWNLYRARHEAATTASSRETGADKTDSAAESGAWRVEALCPREAEFGLPQWVFGYSAYAFIGGGRIVCSYIECGVSQLALLDTATGELRSAGDDSTDVLYLRAEGRRAVFRSGTPARVAAIVARDLDTGAVEVLRRSSDLKLDAGYLSAAQPIEFPTDGGQTAHALYYAPRNRDFRAPEGELPPLLVKSHGGPTAAAVTTLNLGIQYWTSRGFAVLDVNYGGSTGHGRTYRERLAGTWGIVDVDDCVNAARYLIERGLADPARCAIAGGSAGGYTTLSALTFRDLFKAGASHFGVSDLGALVRDTHKFESRYLDKLVGPYPERKDLYDARSPVNFPERLDCPVIFFQGLEDKVVPPNQAELMVEALRRKGLPVAYVAFPGEQHGFRQAANIKRALDGELYFYARVFDFPLADPVAPVPIDNL